MNKNKLNLIYLGQLLLAETFTPSPTNGNHVGIQSSAAVHLCFHVFVSFVLYMLCTTYVTPPHLCVLPSVCRKVNTQRC